MLSQIVDFKLHKWLSELAKDYYLYMFVVSAGRTYDLCSTTMNLLARASDD